MESLILGLEEHKSKSKAGLSEASPGLSTGEGTGVQGSAASLSLNSPPDACRKRPAKHWAVCKYFILSDP